MNRDTLKTGIRTSIHSVLGYVSDIDIDVATGEVLNYLESRPGLLNMNKDVQSQVIRAFWDGNGNATNGKPGLAQFRIYWPNGKISPWSTPHEGKTNNELEYAGLIDLLDVLGRPSNAEGCENMDLVIMGDSQTVLYQVTGKYRVNVQHLVPLRDKAIGLLSQLKPLYKSVELKWVPSAENLVDAHA